MAKGDLTRPVPGAGGTEIGRLMHCIAHMRGSLVDTVLDVRQSARLLGRVAHEVAVGNLDLSARTESQASSLQDTAAALEELASTVQQTAENTRAARMPVRRACDTTVASSAVMGRMVETMAHIEASSRKVNDIIAVIDGMAFQTNVLALNVAVEAARAADVTGS